MAAKARLAEVLGALSIATDLADGFRPEQAVRSTVLACALARAHGLDDSVVADVYWAALLRMLGCTAFAPEETVYGGGNDIGLRSVMGEVDGGSATAAIGTILRKVGAGQPLRRRVPGVLAMIAGPGPTMRHHTAQCDAGQYLARVLGMGEMVIGALGETFARYDGKGYPGTSGTDISIVARVGAVAEQVALAADRHGPGAALRMAQERSGGWFDPALVSTLAEGCHDVVERLHSHPADSAWDAYLDAEPEPRSHLTTAGLDRACDAFGRYADLKSTWTVTHSTGVGALASAAGEAAGLDSATCDDLRRAGLVHDLGVVAVPNGVWDRPGSLNASDWEQVRLHAYWTERVLARTPLLAPMAAAAGAAHERPDGSGYPKGLPGSVLGPEARILAAADAFHALCEARPYRPARDPKEAADVLSEEAGAGRFDLAATRAVLEAAGAVDRRLTPLTWPAGLSDREVEVLRLVATGATNKDIARALGITAKTAAHHVAHIYAKVGCSSRAGAALFAVEHRLVAPAGLPPR